MRQKLDTFAAAVLGLLTAALLWTAPSTFAQEHDRPAIEPPPHAKEGHLQLDVTLPKPIPHHVAPTAGPIDDFHGDLPLRPREPHHVAPIAGPIDRPKIPAGPPRGPWEELLTRGFDKAVAVLSGNEPHLLSENKTDLLSKNKADLLSGNSPTLLSGNSPRLLSGNSPKLLSELSPTLLSGNRPEILSGNQTPLLSGNRVSLFSNIKVELRISNSGNENGNHGSQGPPRLGSPFMGAPGKIGPVPPAKLGPAASKGDAQALRADKAAKKAEISKKRFAQLDANGDGTIFVEEFLRDADK